MMVIVILVMKEVAVVVAAVVVAAVVVATVVVAEAQMHILISLCLLAIMSNMNKNV